MKTNFTLLEFMRDFEYNDNLLWKKKAEEQLIFVRDIIGALAKSPIFVVSTHYSKSCLLQEYYRFNFFEKFDNSDSTDKLEKIRGAFNKRER